MTHKDAEKQLATAEAEYTKASRMFSNQHTPDRYEALIKAAKAVLTAQTANLVSYLQHENGNNET